jgi:hypothetical protein
LANNTKFIIVNNQYNSHLVEGQIWMCIFNVI